MPPYFERRWRAFQSGDYVRECELFESLTGMSVDKTRPLFIFAGNLEADRAGTFVSFGLAPHSRNEHIAITAAEDYGWRINYFDHNGPPRHRIHSYLHNIFLSFMGRRAPGAPSARWLHTHSYLTFDLVPYYVREWKSPKWGPDLNALVIDHLKGCAGLLAGASVTLAIFTGRAWEEIFLQDILQLRAFCASTELQLSCITGKGYHRARVHIGSVDICGHRFPATVLSHLVHQIRGLSYQNAFDLGQPIAEQVGVTEQDTGANP